MPNSRANDAFVCPDAYLKQISSLRLSRFLRVHHASIKSQIALARSLSHPSRCMMIKLYDD